jgi:hypothetical protein
MKSPFRTSLLAVSLLASSAFAATTTIARTSLAVPESIELRSLCDAELGALRAGRLAAPEALAVDERAELQRAADEQVGLQDLRAGELTEHEWTLIAIGALVVLILVLI